MKRNINKYSEAKLIAKAESLLKKLKCHGYHVEYRGFALENLVCTMDEFQSSTKDE